MRAQVSVFRLMLGLLFASIGSAAFSQRITGHLPNPDLQSIFPPGVELGQTVRVRVAGRDLVMPTQLRFSNDGLTSKAVDDKGTFNVAAADSLAPGIYEVRVLGKYGLSTPRAFVVSDSSESLEKEPNDQPEQATLLTTGSVINGRSAKAGDRDIFKLSAVAGQTIHLQCLAETIDSKMEVALTVRNARGEVVAVDHDTVRRDASIQYQPIESGDHFVEVRDMIHEGSSNHFYRLIFRNDALPEPVFPTVISSSDARQDALFCPADNGRIELLTRLRRGYHTTAPSSLIGTHAFRSSPFDPIVVNKLPVHVESTDNDSQETADSLSLPVTVAGRFEPAGDRDWYRFEAKKGQTLEIEVVSQRLGVAADPFFVLFRREDGVLKQVATADDQVLLGYDQNSGGFENVGRFAFNSRTDDPAYRLTVPTDGEYALMVRELNHTHFGDPSFSYQLSVRPPKPDFQVVATAHTPVDLAPNFRDYYPYTPTLSRGGSARIDLQVFRQGGFKGEIRFHVENLPPGVSVPETRVAADRDFVPLVLVADSKIAPWAGDLRIVAEAIVNGVVVRRAVAAATVIWNGITLRDGPRSRRMLSMPLSILERQAKLFVSASPDVIVAKKGETIEVPVEFRRGDGFDGPIMVTNIGVPKSLVTVKPTTFKASENSGVVKLTVSSKARPTVVTFCLDAKIDLPDPRVEDTKKAKSLAVLVSSTPLTIQIVE